MPYKSQAQRAYFNANKVKMESQGVSVKEWNETSKGKKLPKKVKKSKDVQSSMWRQGQHE
jgi:hypothetical protein